MNETLLRDICESDEFNPDHKDAICIEYGYLARLINEHFQGLNKELETKDKLIDELNERLESSQRMNKYLARKVDCRGSRIEVQNKMIAEWNLVLKLTADECSSVTIHHDNADFSGSNCAITHEIILKKGVTFYGETKLECLKKAYGLQPNVANNQKGIDNE